VYEQLLPYKNLVALAASEASVGPVSLPLGRLATRLGNHEDAAAHFEIALGLTLQMQARPWIAHTYHSYATLLATRNDPGDRDKATEFLISALELAVEVGMPVLAEKIERGLAELGAKPRRRTPAGKRDKEAPKGSVLTPREREVAALVAEGMTNRQIGESLFVAERTAETHVENILMKLGFTSRSQVARWVLDTGFHVEDT
jgi:DNA-binding CsgD family transcriptional regulator